MLDFYSDQPSISPTLPLPEKQSTDDSKIPFLFAAIPHKLFDYGLKPSTIGVYCGLARYVNWKAQMTTEGRKVITGWTIPLSQKTLGNLLNSTRQTMICHLKILANLGVVEFKKSFNGCYQYRLIAYKQGIEEIQREQRKRAEGRKKEPEHFTQPGVPTPEQVDEYDKADTNARKQTPSASRPGVEKFDRMCQEISHIKEMLRNIKSNTLSEGGQPVKTETAAAEGEDWREYQKYTKEFYGEPVTSKTLNKGASIYFKEKVEEYVISDDGFDVVMQMIPIIKRLGGKTHKAFDTEYGIRAFNKAMELRDYQRQREAYSHDSSSSPSNPSSRPSDGPEPDSANDEPFDDAQPSDSPNDIPPRRPAHIPTSAKQAVAGQIYGRHCLASIGQGEAYTDDEIEELWEKAYQRFGQPQSPEVWVDDRIDLRDRLVKKGIREPYTDLEIEELRQKAGELCGDTSEVLNGGKKLGEVV